MNNRKTAKRSNTYENQELCDCPCHKIPNGVCHPVPCCKTCPKCGKRISRGEAIIKHIRKNVLKMNELDAIINRRAKIEDYDHNDAFGEFLPRNGQIKSRYITKNVDDWYFFKLDDPFEYEGKLQKYFLIRSKWVGRVINDKKECGVFILLIPEMKMLENCPINVTDFDHVAWGFAKLI